MYNLGLARFFARDIAGAMEVISKVGTAVQIFFVAWIC